ncbi:MAG: MFS transporter [Thermoanaerobaculia bacterium]|nr:MFS transporter [Thermoanaerobaculia bacterium]
MTQSGGRRPYPKFILFLTVFLDLAGFGMILPLLPFYAETYGAGAFQVGILFAAYSLAQAIGAPLLGRLSDLKGRRPVLIGSLLVNVGALILFALGRDFTTLLIARSISGLSAANFTIAQAYIADVTAPEERAKGLGMIGAALGLGFVLGPAIGGILSLYSHVAVPLGAAGLVLLDVGLVATRLPESRPPEARARLDRRFDPPWSGLARAPRPVAGLLALYFLVIFAFAGMETTLALYCEGAFGFGVAEISALMVLIGIVIVIVQGGLVGRLAKRYGETRLVLWGLLAMVVGMFTLPLAPTVALLALTTVFLALGSGLHNPSLLSLVSRLTPKDDQGATLGLTRSSGSLARAFGPLLGGWLFETQSPQSPFFAAGALLVLSLMAAVPLMRRLGALLPPRGSADPAPVPAETV